MGVKGVVWQSAWELTRTRGRAVRKVTSDALKNEPPLWYAMPMPNLKFGAENFR